MEARHHALGLHLFEDELHARVQLREAWQKQRYERRRERGNDAETERPLERAWMRDLSESLGLPQDDACLRGHARSDVGGNDGLAGAIEEARSDDLLDLLELRAQRRLGHAALVRCGPERPRVVDGDEVSQMGERERGEVHSIASY